MLACLSLANFSGLLAGKAMITCKLLIDKGAALREWSVLFLGRRLMLRHPYFKKDYKIYGFDLTVKC
jgi:hypothetical protein